MKNLKNLFIENELGEEFKKQPAKFLMNHCYELSLDHYSEKNGYIANSLDIQKMIMRKAYKKNEWFKDLIFEYIEDISNISDFKTKIKNLEDEEKRELFEMIKKEMLECLTIQAEKFIEKFGEI